MKRIYLDYASLTPVDGKVLRIMKKFSKKDFMNPSALYVSAVSAKKASMDARERVAKILHAHADEIIFTGSGTESNNLAIRGIVDAYGGGHVIVSAIEHSSVLETMKFLEKKGISVTYVKVDNSGIIDPDEIAKHIRRDTFLISVMMVNNELGTIQPIEKIAKVVREARKKFGTETPFLHTDACQAPNTIDVHVEKLNVDALTLDGHKIYGPRGVGMLYLKRGVKCTPIIFGGGQENGLRSATENIPGMQGFALALEICDTIRQKEYSRLLSLKKFFIEELQKINSDIKVNGSLEMSSPHIANVYIPSIDSEFFVLKLDANGIECSTKSACLRDENESYVLKAIGSDSVNSIRFSFGRETTKSDLKKMLKVIKKFLK